MTFPYNIGKRMYDIRVHTATGIHTHSRPRPPAPACQCTHPLHTSTYVSTQLQACTHTHVHADLLPRLHTRLERVERVQKPLERRARNHPRARAPDQEPAADASRGTRASGLGLGLPAAQAERRPRASALGIQAAARREQTRTCARPLGRGGTDACRERCQKRTAKRDSPRAAWANPPPSTRGSPPGGLPRQHSRRKRRAPARWGACSLGPRVVRDRPRAPVLAQPAELILTTGHSY